MELVADFQQFYGLQIEDVWTGKLSPSRVLDRIPGLLSEPWSRYRAAYYKDNPPSLSTSDAPSWLGWTPDSGYLVTAVNLLLSKWGGNKAKGRLLKYPSDARRVVRAKTIPELMRALGKG